jgi:hypothetical protein
MFSFAPRGVRHLLPSIKPGLTVIPGFAIYRADPESRKSLESPRQAEHDKQRAIQLLGRFRVNATDHPPDTISVECDHLVRHDLGTKA